MKTINELMSAVQAILPNAAFDEDNEGQVIIYTNLRWKDENGTLEDIYV